MMQTYHETGREVPVVRSADVIVCGGGPAGVAAAIAAARLGADTHLIELRGCLGGVWTAGLLSWIIDSANKPGIMQEITDRLAERGACTRDETKIINYDEEPERINHDLKRDFGYDAEQMKLLLDEMCAEAGVKVRLHTQVVAAVRDEHNRLTLAVTESKSGREAWAAPVFIDTTGDGDLAARAGCGFDMGRPGSGEVQPMTLMMLVTGLNIDDVMPYVTEWHAGLTPPKYRLFEAFKRGGVEISYSKPCLFRIHDDLYALAINHEYGVSAVDADQITQATIRARAELHRAINALRGMGGIWADVRIVATAEQIGVREGRRIHGRYTVSSDDLVTGRRHEDSAATVTFPVDVHSTNPDRDKSYGNEGVRSQPYDIPYRALIAKDVDGLLLAGRNISGDFIAHASYRVTGNAVAMGQTAGAAAALAALSRRLPQDVTWPEIQQALTQVSPRQPV
jgi:hypothetical protein